MQDLELHRKVFKNRSPKLILELLEMEVHALRFLISKSAFDLIPYHSSKLLPEQTTNLLNIFIMIWTYCPITFQLCHVWNSLKNRKSTTTTTIKTTKSSFKKKKKRPILITRFLTWDQNIYVHKVFQIVFMEFNFPFRKEVQLLWSLLISYRTSWFQTAVL